MPRMELIAGDARVVLALIAATEAGAESQNERYEAYLPLGGAMDPTWLDLFAEAIRSTIDAEEPVDFIDARFDLGLDDTALTVERVDPAWITAIARLPDTVIDPVTGRWIDRLEEEFGALPREEKPWIRQLAGQVVAFCRDADRAPDVVFVWSLR
jgi:hypothetical protein